MTPAERAAWHARVVEMCKTQGVPPRLTDPAVMARIAAIVTAGETRRAS